MDRDEVGEGRSVHGVRSSRTTDLRDTPTVREGVRGGERERDGQRQGVSE